MPMLSSDLRARASPFADLRLDDPAGSKATPRTYGSMHFRSAVAPGSRHVTARDSENHPPRVAVETALRQWLTAVGIVKPQDHERDAIDDILLPRSDVVSTLLSQMAAKAALPTQTPAAAAKTTSSALFDMATKATDADGVTHSLEKLLAELLRVLCDVALPPSHPPTVALGTEVASSKSDALDTARGSVTPAPVVPSPSTPLAVASPMYWRARAASRQVLARRQTLRDLRDRQPGGAAAPGGVPEVVTPLTGNPAGFVQFDDHLDESPRRAMHTPSSQHTVTASQTATYPMLPPASQHGAGQANRSSGSNQMQLQQQPHPSPPSHPMVTHPAAQPPRSGATSPASNSQASIVSLMVAAPQHTMSAAVGEELDDGTVDVNQYVLLQPLGRGKQGEVFLAMDSDANELRAVKVIRRPRRKAIANAHGSARGGTLHAGSMAGAPLSLARDRARQQLEREIAIMKKCRHRNVVALYEVIDDPDLDCMYLVMQYVEHGPLVSLAPDGTTSRTVAPCLLAHYARQLCAGLQYLHKHGVIHRDIKPDNILLGPQDTVYLADFGMADAFDVDADAEAADGAAPHAVKGTRGTVAFMAPEIVDATASTAAAGEAVDVWALGVTLYALLYGRLPWAMGGGTYDVMQQIATKEIEYPDVVAAGTPKDIAAGDSCESCDEDASPPNAPDLARTIAPVLDSPTDDHASPGGASAAASTAGAYLRRESSSLSSNDAAVAVAGWPRLLRGMLRRDPAERLTLRQVRRKVIDLDGAMRRSRAVRGVPGAGDEVDANPITTVRRPAHRRVTSME